eukprot:3125130-Alexandrium_andersonii.AAC.1
MLPGCEGPGCTVVGLPECRAVDPLISSKAMRFQIAPWLLACRGQTICLDEVAVPAGPQGE